MHFSAAFIQKQLTLLAFKVGLHLIRLCNVYSSYDAMLSKH